MGVDPLPAAVLALTCTWRQQVIVQYYCMCMPACIPRYVAGTPVTVGYLP